MKEPYTREKLLNELHHLNERGESFDPEFGFALMTEEEKKQSKTYKDLIGIAEKMSKTLMFKSGNKKPPV